jgi:hypothetical protein
MRGGIGFMVTMIQDDVDDRSGTGRDPIGRYERAKCRMREAHESGIGIADASAELDQARHALGELFEAIWPG